MAQYWWGEYTDELAEKGWIDNGENQPYKLITTNGKWEVIRFYCDGALYSFCPACGYTHSCYHYVRNPVTEEWEGIVYASEKEFHYCPMCGMSMLEEDSQNDVNS